VKTHPPSFILSCVYVFFAFFKIEPMLTQGAEACFEWEDNWTVSTMDGGLAAQFEHTVLITDSGVEILTVPE